MCAFQCANGQLSISRAVSRLPLPLWKGRKVSRGENRASRRNSLDISKADIQLGMSEFDPSQGSQAVRCSE
jgi:hypothetical protein